MIKTQTKPLDNNRKIIRTSITGDDRRAAVLYKLFPNHAVIVETLVFRWMDQLCEKYNGGYWHIYELSNGGFYMALKTESEFEVLCPSFQDSVQLSADATGVVASLYAINQLASGGEESIIDLYYLLRDFATEHQESAKIFRAID